MEQCLLFKTNFWRATVPIFEKKLVLILELLQNIFLLCDYFLYVNNVSFF